MAKFTAKQQAFINEYLCDLNATQAAIRAGYSKRTAGKQGYQLLENTRIQSEIQKAMNERSKRTEITADRVLEEIAKLAFSDMRKFATWGPNGVKLIPSEELDDDSAACVAEVSQTFNEGGSTLKFKLHDKKGSLDLLGKHLKLFTDNVNLSGDVGVIIKDDIE